MALPVFIVAIGFMLLGGSVISLGAKGFSQEGLPLGFGGRLYGSPARLVGSLLVLLGTLIFVATAALLLGQR